MTRSTLADLERLVTRLERIVAILKAIDRVTTDAELVRLLAKLKAEQLSHFPPRGVSTRTSPDQTTGTLAEQYNSRAAEPFP